MITPLTVKKINDFQAEIPVYNSEINTIRSLENNIRNSLAIDNVENSAEPIQELLKELIIRFDTNPKNYTKHDIVVLLKLLKSYFKFIESEQEIDQEIKDELNQIINNFDIYIQNYIQTINTNDIKSLF